MRKILSIAAMSIVMATGAAFAQTTTTGAATDPSAEDKALYQPFYTDDTMGTMRSDDEFAAAWTAMTAENQAKVREQCVAPANDRLKDFCGKVPAQ